MVAVPIAKGRTPAELRALARRERDGRVERPAAGAGQRPGRDEPGRGGAGRRHGPADPARLGAPLQRRGRRGPARPAAAGPAVRAWTRAGRPRSRRLILRGPKLERDGCVAWRARDLRELVERRFGVRLQRERDQAAAARARPLLAEGAAGPPRGRPEGAGALQKNLPGADRGGRARAPRAKRVELWFMDEARDRAEGRRHPRLVPEGRAPARACASRASASAYLFGAVCPERGEGVALVLPEVSTAAMDVFLAELARAVPAGTHAALVLDGAGWHVSEDLVVPANLTLIHPPPYSPELNPVERVWEYLRDRWLSHRVLAGGYEAVVDAACAAWNALLAEPGRLRSLTSFPWLPSAVSTS